MIRLKIAHPGFKPGPSVNISLKRHENQEGDTLKSSAVENFITLPTGKHLFSLYKLLAQFIIEIQQIIGLSVFLKDPLPGI